MRLSWTAAHGAPSSAELGAGVWTIGRDSGSDVRLEGPDVSRRHLEITVTTEGFTVADLGSTSGTWLEGQKLAGLRHLHSEVTVRLGSVPLRIAPLGEGSEAGEQVILSADATKRDRLPLGEVSARDAGRLRMLYELPLQFAAAGAIAQLHAAVLTRALEMIPGARRGVLLVVEPSTGKLVIRAAEPLGNDAVSRTLVKRAASEQRGFIWSESEDLSPSLSVVRHGIRTGLYVPLVWAGETVGVICADNPRTSKAFTEEDLQFLIFVAHYAAAAVSNQLLQLTVTENNRTMEHLLANFSPKLRSTLLQKAREGRLQPGGEKSEVTILMSDLRGFTRASAAMAAEDVVEMLNDYFSHLADIIFQHDGTIDKFIGDAVLVVFGSPERDDRHPQMAVQCALELRSAMESINARRTAEGRAACGIGIGIHTGEVLHGFIGAPERLEFTVIGDTVNRASRYCDAAAAGEILVSPVTADRASTRFSFRPCQIPTKHEGPLEALAVESGFFPPTQ